MGQFMGHDHTLVTGRAPISNVKLLGPGIIEPFDLLGKHVDHESIQVKPPGEQTKGFGGTRVCVTLGGILFLVHLLNHIGANFLAGAQRFL